MKFHHCKIFSIQKSLSSYRFYSIVYQRTDNSCYIFIMNIGTRKTVSLIYIHATFSISCILSSSCIFWIFFNSSFCIWAVFSSISFAFRSNCSVTCCKFKSVCRGTNILSRQKRTHKALFSSTACNSNIITQILKSIKMIKYGYRALSS